jgi:hypothetical protein
MTYRSCSSIPMKSSRRYVWTMGWAVYRSVVRRACQHTTINLEGYWGRESVLARGEENPTG